jgi:hypothetical protein
MISNFLGQTARALGEGATDVVARGVINWEKTKITVNEKFATLTPNNQHNENK